MTMENEMLEKIEQFIDTNVRPALASHGGGIEVVKFEESKLYVKLAGGCRGCAGARMTIKNGVERLVKEKFSEVSEVVDTTDHSA